MTKFCPQEDDKSQYECWQDPATQKGYNFGTYNFFDEFCKGPIRSHLLVVIIRNEDNEPIGIVSLPPKSSPLGGKYGRSAFALATKYFMVAFNLEYIYAGCDETNILCRKMLESCEFTPNLDGDSHEIHNLTGEPTIQLDFVFGQHQH